ncbi:hypothetical protein P8935_24375 [Telmatobacter sp. DSM 110680]|uniref:DUF4168 domain-containing protein n=1 Tax=Telmatobacter sp. DSM 110680 TaxID=3036704 RepID=A0AAU7DK61_9BACT
MAWILENPRLVRVNLLTLLSIMIFVVPTGAQIQETKLKLAELKPGLSSTNLGSNQIPTQDPKPQVSFGTTTEEMRQAQIEDDTKRLYQLSAELRAEVAKTYKESLSIQVLKKAEEIEKLSRSLKALLNQEAAGH